MYIRGSDNADEYYRNDEGLYKGIVVKNNDPQHLYRVKVYIPELSNQPHKGWLDSFKNFSMRFPGKNNTTDIWSDTKLFEEVASCLPWAEPCFPLIGENSPGRYQASDETATISDTDYDDAFKKNDTKPVSIEAGAYSPAFLYETFELSIGDAFTHPIDNLCGNSNPYSYEGRPSCYSNKAKGIFSVPNVGTKVWVFHYSGDLNFPVYFGIRHDFREISLVNNMDQKDAKQHSLDYPDIFENIIPKK